MGARDSIVSFHSSFFRKTSNLFDSFIFPIVAFLAPINRIDAKTEHWADTNEGPSLLGSSFPDLAPPSSCWHFAHLTPGRFVFEPALFANY